MLWYCHFLGRWKKLHREKWKRIVFPKYVNSNPVMTLFSICLSHFKCSLWHTEHFHDLLPWNSNFLWKLVVTVKKGYITFSKSSIDTLFKSFYMCIILYTSLYSLTKSTHFYERLLLLLLSIWKRVEWYFFSLYLKGVGKNTGGRGGGGLIYHNELWWAH